MQSIRQYISKAGQSQTFRNSSWSLLDVTLYPLLMMLLTPMYIRYLGVEQYGIWMLAGNLAQLMNALNMGVGESTVRLVSKNRHEALRQDLSAAVSSNLLVSAVLCLASVGCGALIAANLGRIGYFDLRASQAEDAGYMIVLLTASVGLRFIEQVLLSVFKGFERFDLAAKLSALSRNGVIAGSMILLWCGYDFIAILWLTVLLNVLNLVLQLTVISKQFPFLRFRFDPARQKLSGIIQANGWYWLQFIIAMTGFLADRFLVAHYMGISIFGYYSIVAMVGSQLHSILVTFGTFVFPRVSYLGGEGGRLLDVFYRASSAIQGLGWLFTCTLLVAGPPVFRLWLGEITYEAVRPFLDLYLVYQSVMLLAIVPYQFVNGTEHVRFNSLFEASMRALQIALMIVFYHLLGAAGILFGMIAGALLVIPLQLVLFGTYVLRVPGSRLLLVMLPLAAILPMVFFRDVYVRTGCSMLCAWLYYRFVWPHMLAKSSV